MRDLLTIDIIDNGQGGHKNLLFCIPDLIDDIVFDTYYFYLAVEPVETIGDIKIAVSRLLQFCHNKVSESKNGETIFLPIDFSDEYTGCLKVRHQDDQLVLTYGFSRREGYTVNPLNPEDYYKQITDFEADSERHLTVDQSVFVSILDTQIQKLKGVTT